MKTTLALLRGINVGGRNTLPMKALVAIFEGLGFEHARTLIQSGNVVFRSKRSCTRKTAGDIASAIQARHGFAPSVLLLAATDLEEAIARNPFATTDGKALHFFFLDSAPKDPELDSLARLKTGSEQFALVGTVFYLFAPDGIGRSKLATRVERVLGVPVTARNWNTVSKLWEMVRG